MKDILVDADLDLAIVNGDLVVGDGTEQHKAFLLISNKGEWRENPVLGVGIVRYLNDSELSPINEIITQFELAGMEVGFVALSENGVLESEAVYRSLLQTSFRAFELVDTNRTSFSYIVNEGQNAIDLCIQLYGTMDNYIRMFQDTKKAIDWRPSVGEEIKISAPAGDADMVNFFTNEKLFIATKDGDISEFNYDFSNDFNI